MKKSLLNFGAILVAFFIGVSVNNSCADPDDYNTPTDEVSTDELWGVIDELKSQVEALSSKLKDLEATVPQIESRLNELENNDVPETESECGDFYVDGLWFDRSGNCSSPVLVYRKSTDKGGSSYETTYYYDEFGRLVGYDADNNNVTIQYEGNVQTTISKVRNTTSGALSTTTMTYEYK